MTRQRLRFPLLIVLLAVALTGPAPLRGEDDANASFRLLFGDKFNQALATSAVTDDLALAAEIVTAAKTLTQSPKLLALLCDRAYQLGLKDPEGYEAAAGAMSLLIEHVPERAAEGHDKLVDVRQKSFVRAKPDQRVAMGQALIDAMIAAADARLDQGGTISTDAATAGAPDAAAAIGLYRRAGTVAAQIKSDSAALLKAKLDAALVAERTEKQVDALRTRVLENAGDTASAEQLVRLLIVDLDRPAAAQKYLNHVKDADLKKHMVLAAKPVGELAEADAQSLGAWYRTQSTQAKEPLVKAAMLARAAACFEQFLAVHTAEGLPRTTVNLALEDVKRALAKLAEAGAAPPRVASAPKVIRLFNGKDLTHWKPENAKQSNWTVGLAQVDPASPDRFRTIRGNDLINTNRGTQLITDALFGDCVLELEFMLAQGANSGVYVMGEYEIQLWDAPGGKKGGRPEQMTGAVYNVAAPKVDADKPAGQWQKMLIDFRAPRFDKIGTKTANARFNKVVLNGRLIHENVEVRGPSGQGLTGRESPAGPLMLQGSHGVVGFRDITIKPAAEK